MPYKDKGERQKATLKARAVRKKKHLEEALEALGGKCAACAATTELEFHHIDPSTKEHNITRHAGVLSKERLMTEVKKCQLLCNPCHKAVHRLMAARNGSGRPLTLSEISEAARVINGVPAEAMERGAYFDEDDDPLTNRRQ